MIGRVKLALLPARLSPIPTDDKTGVLLLLLPPFPLLRLRLELPPLLLYGSLFERLRLFFPFRLRLREEEEAVVVVDEDGVCL